MSASMLRQLLEDAKSAIKQEQYERALESSRRVTQFDPNNFQAFVCVGKAHFHLRHFEECEDAYRRAADLQPGMPFAWKGLLDLFQEQHALAKTVEPLEHLVAILKKTKKPRAYQKMLLELATTTKELEQFPKSLDAFLHLLQESQEGNLPEEMPNTLTIWLDIMEIATQTNPRFDWTKCDAKCNWQQLCTKFLQFFANNWPQKQLQDQDQAICQRLEGILDFVVQEALQKHEQQLQKLDELNKSILKWFPSAKTAGELLLLRSEDQDSPIDADDKAKLLENLRVAHPTSAFVGVFDALKQFEDGELDQARNSLEKLVLQTNVSQFQQMQMQMQQQKENRIQIEVASLVSAHRVLVEIALRREPKRSQAKQALVLLDKAIRVAEDKKRRFGCVVHTKTFGIATQKLIQAKAYEALGDSSAALESYLLVLQQSDSDKTCQDLQVAVKTLENCIELLLSSDQPDQASSQFETFVKNNQSGVHQITDPAIKRFLEGSLVCLGGWIQLHTMNLPQAQEQMQKGLELLSQIDPTLLSSSDGDVTPSVLKMKRAVYMKRLAVVYWRLDGQFRQQKQFCLQQLLQSAKLNPVNDPETFVWLGKWYFAVANDVVRAEKCYLKALGMDLSCDFAAKELSGLYEALDKQELLVKLWQETIANGQARDKDISWAHLKLAQHQLTLGDERAIGNLHQVLRREPRNSSHWVALGHAYQVFDKQQAAHRSYLQAIELGETSWCVQCQVAEIEGQLSLFDQAVERMEQVQESLQQVNEPANAMIVSVLYGRLLLAQARTLCGEGLYGRAATSLQKASELLQSHSSYNDVDESLGQVLRLKLLGDVHSFAFYLSPQDFGAEEWLTFLALGQKAYHQSLDCLKTIQQRQGFDEDPSTHQKLEQLESQLLYDAGLSCWYQVQATCCVHGMEYSAFKGGSSSIHEKSQCLLTSSLEDRRSVARELMLQSLRVDPSNSLAWNGLAIVHDQLVIKQFAWTRAIQWDNLDAAWANLGFLYLQNSKKQLAQKAFYHLQSVNPHNVAMWTGYGLLMKENQMVLETVEAFACALENVFELDALYGLTANVLLAQSKGLLTGNNKSQHVTDAFFAIQKFIERDPFNAQAYYLLGKFQMAKELIQPAMESFRTSLELTVNSKTRNSQSAVLTRVLRANYLVALLKLQATDTLSANELQQLTGDDLTLKCFVSIAAKKWSSALDALKVLKDNHQPDFFHALSQIQLQVLECLIWYQMGEGKKSLSVLKELLLRDEHEKENHEMVLIALSSLCLVHLVPEEENAEILKAAVKVATSSTTIDKAVTMDVKLQLLLLEALEMASDGDATHTHYYAAQIHINPANTFTYSQLGFTLMSAGNFNMVLKCQQVAEMLALEQTNAFYGAENDGMVQAATLSAFGGLLGSSSAASSAVKLLRMEPRSQWAQLLLAAHLLKQSTFETASPQGHLVSTAINLLKAENESNTVLSVTVLKNLLLCHGLVLQGKQPEAEEIGTKTVQAIEQQVAQNPAVQQEFQLIKARILSIIRPQEAIEAYKSALKTSVDTTVLIKELAALYEGQGLLQHAMVLWQTLSKKASAQEDKFFANLRLAVLNGLLNRHKVAIRHAKAAVELSASHPAQNKVALFVQSLF